MSIQSISSSVQAQSNPETSGVSREVARAIALAQKKAAPVQDKAPAAQASPEQLADAIKSVREYIQPFNSNLEFSINDETDQVVIKIIDTATKEVIRQIPSEEMLAIAKALDSIKGLFLKQMA